MSNEQDPLAEATGADLLERVITVDGVQRHSSHTKSWSRVLHIDDWSQCHIDICVILDDVKQKLHFVFLAGLLLLICFGLLLSICFCAQYH